MGIENSFFQSVNIFGDVRPRVLAGNDPLLYRRFRACATFFVDASQGDVDHGGGDGARMPMGLDAERRDGGLGDELIVVLLHGDEPRRLNNLCGELGIVSSLLTTSVTTEETASFDIGLFRTFIDEFLFLGSGGSVPLLMSIMPSLARRLGL